MSQIKMPKHFRDRWFSTYFGTEVQEYLANAGSTIEIDFSDCEWVDPIPAMALLCHLHCWAARHKGGAPAISINLGHSSVRPEDVPKSRARLFLTSHGFLRSIAETCRSTKITYHSNLEGYPVQFDYTTVGKLEEATSMAAGCHLLYGRDPACPPTILTSGKSASEIASFVDDTIRSMDAKLFSGRQSQFLYRDSALVRVRQVATEILLNASEHAYAPENPGPICIYARLRRHADHWGDADMEDTTACPLISHIHDVTSGKYIELFVCDVGYGLCHHSQQWALVTSDPSLQTLIASATKSTRTKIGQLVSLVFRTPISRHRRDLGPGTRDRSNVTGLSHVNTVLSKQNDRSRLFVAPIWNAGPHPRPGEGYKHTSKEYFSRVDPVGYAPTGTFFHFALEISHSALSLKGWLKPSTDAGDEAFCSELQAVFRRTGDDVEALPVFDLAACLAQEGTRTEVSMVQIETEFEQKVRESGRALVIRMSRDFRKNLTDALVNRWLSDTSPMGVAETLAFCDLSRAQAVLLSEHLQTLTPEEGSLEPGCQKKILIVSEDLTSLTLALASGRNTRLWFTPLDQHDRALVIQVVGTLRESDSHTFWRRADELEATLLLSDVRWSTGLDGEDATVLPIYLDYSLAMQHRELAKIVRRALRRALAAFPSHIALPIDELIRPDLADASRWMERFPTDRTTPKCFVISSVVTGATVGREARHRGAPAAVLACFIADTDPQLVLDEKRFRYFSALRWAPSSKSSSSRGDFRWERIPGTPYVRPFIPCANEDESNVLLIRPISRVFTDRGADEHRQPSVAESYHEWHRDHLLKVGHWNIERRHDLLEVNHLNALQISAVSGRGFYEWLTNKLTTEASGISYPLLVYPPGRLNAIMVRHLFKLKDSLGQRRLHEKWRAVPISYLPDIGDGLKQMTQLAEEHIRQSEGAVGGKVFFLDIGYVGNRTFRHTQRQLLALGVAQVVGFGLLNRTSAPALTESALDHQIKCYWRFDVPSLDDQRSCPVCSGLRAMDALLERTRRVQVVVVRSVERIYSDWALADPGQQWEEHGLVPLKLPVPIKKKFGFLRQPDPVGTSNETPGQQSLIFEDGEPITLLRGHKTWWERNQFLEWNHVWLRDSAQATAYAIEIARTLSAPTYPLRLARELAEKEPQMAQIFIGVAAAIEVLGSYLLLSAHELPVAVKEAAGIQLLRYLAKLEEAPSDFIDNVSSDRLVRLRGLASLALINLDASTKKLLLDEIMSLVTKTRFINAETRIAVMTVLMDTIDEAPIATAETPTFDRRVHELLKSEAIRNSDVANVVRWNYWSLTLIEHCLREQFEHALRFFGAGEAHGDCMDRLKDAESWAGQQPGPSWTLCRTTLQTAYSMICRGGPLTLSDHSTAPAPGELFSALCNFDVVDLQLLNEMSKKESVDRPSSEVGDAIDLVTRVRKSFQQSMIRFEMKTPTGGFAVLLAAINSLILRTAQHNASEVVVVQFDCDYLQTEGARYLLFGIELNVLLDRLIKDALRYAPANVYQAPHQFGEAHADALGRAFVSVTGTATGKILLTVWNCGSEAADASAFIRQQEGLAIVHANLGSNFKRRVDEIDYSRWFCTEIEFLWVQGGKS